MSSVWKIRAYAVLASLVLLFLILVVMHVFLPGQAVIDTAQNSGSVYFAADRRIVFSPGDCVQVNWRVEGVREVYVVDPVVGEGTKRLCIERNSLPTMEVIFQEGNGAREVFVLPITFFTDQPYGLALIAGIILALLAMLLVLLAPAPAATITASAAGVAGSAPSRRANRFESALAFIGGVLLLLALTIGALELLLRFYFSTFGAETERIRYLYSTEQIEALQARLLALPFVEYGLSPRYPDHNDLGWRGEEISLPKPDGVFRIVAMGASTTYGYTPVDETYPAWLQRILREDYGYENVEVVNAGVFGYTSFNSLISLAFRVLELEPDLIIYYEATNDTIPREMQPECYRGINPLRGMDSRTRISQPQIPNLSPSVLYRIISITAGWAVDPSSLETVFTGYTIECAPGVNSEWDELPRELAAQRVPFNPPIYYERNLRSMIGMARIHNIPMMLATWGFDESSPEAVAFWQTEVAEHNAIVTRLADEYDLLFLDYAPLAPQEDENWSDYIHMNSAGSRHQAEAFAAYLDDEGIINQGN